MAHPNEELIRNGYEAFSKADMEAVTEFFADDIVWHVGGQNPLSGDYRGKDEVIGFFAKLAQTTGGTLSLEIHDVIANDEHGVALVASTAEREGKKLEQRAAHIFHLKDGKAVEFWGFGEDDRAADEFFS